MAKTLYKTCKTATNWLKTELPNYQEWELVLADVFKWASYLIPHPALVLIFKQTTIDAFSRYLFAYRTTRMRDLAVSRVIMFILFKHKNTRHYQRQL